MRQFQVNRLALATALVAAAAGTVQAQEFVLDEIVVTAQKRAQSLQDVPIAVAAVSGEKINDVGITGLEELTSYTPNVNINQGFAAPNLYMRGVGSGTNAGFEQSVGLYIDGVYSGRGQLANVPTTLDLERVELLKGPQGILFGKNTIAGAINITSAKPTDYFEAYADALYEPEQGEEIYTAVVSGPLAANLSGRLALRYEGFDGWWDNITLDETGPQKNNWFSRGTLRWEPSNELEVLAKYEYGDFSVDANPALVYQSDQPLNYLGQEVFPVVGDSDKGAADYADKFDTRTDVFALTVNYELVGNTLTSISAYSAYDFTRHANSDIANTAALNRMHEEEFKQLSQEIRLVSPGGETFDWIVGGYYQQTELDISRRLVDLDFALAGPLVALPLVRPMTSEPSMFDQESSSWALFAQGTWKLADSVRISGGIRYNEEGKELDKRINAEGYGVRTPVGVRLAIPVSGVTPTGTGLLVGDLRSHEFVDVKRDEEKFSWSANIQWDVNPDAMLYASVGTGYKGGGFDGAYSGQGESVRIVSLLDPTFVVGNIPGVDSTILEYDEETVLAYELGAKMTLADGAANLNIAIFRMEYDDLQVSSLVGDNFQVGNAGQSISQGVEIDGRWRVTQRLTIGGSLSYLDAYYDEFTGATCTVPQATDPVANPGCLRADGSNIVAGEAGGQDLSGETLTFAPDWSANFNIAYVYPLPSDLELHTSLDLNYTDDFYSALDLDPNTRHDSYTKVNARIALVRGDGKWSLALLGKNLTDKQTTVWNNDVPLTDSNSYFGIPERPRSVAIQARYRFD